MNKDSWHCQEVLKKVKKREKKVAKCVKRC